MKPNSQTIIISHAEAQTIQSYLDGTAGVQGSDRVISKTAVFPNGMEMDVKCCGSDTEASWAEAVLFLTTAARYTAPSRPKSSWACGLLNTKAPNTK